jgi:hypothetical protein
MPKYVLIGPGPNNEHPEPRYIRSSELDDDSAVPNDPAEAKQRGPRTIPVFDRNGKQVDVMTVGGAGAGTATPTTSTPTK